MILDLLRYCYMTEADMTKGQSTTRGRESRKNAIAALFHDSNVGLSLQGASEDVCKMWTRNLQQTASKIARDRYTGITPIPYVDRSTLVQEVDISLGSKPHKEIANLNLVNDFTINSTSCKKVACRYAPRHKYMTKPPTSNQKSYLGHLPASDLTPMTEPAVYKCPVPFCQLLFDPCTTLDEFHDHLEQTSHTKYFYSVGLNQCSMGCSKVIYRSQRLYIHLATRLGDDSSYNNGHLEQHACPEPTCFVTGMNLVALVQHWILKHQLIAGLSCALERCRLSFPTTLLLQIHKATHDKAYIHLLPSLKRLARKTLLDLSVSLTTILPGSSGDPDYPAFIFRESADCRPSADVRRALTRHSSMTAVMTEFGKAGIVQYRGTVIMIHAAYVRSRDVPTFWQEPSLEALRAQQEAHLRVDEGKEVKNAECFSHAISSRILRSLQAHKRPVPCLLEALIHCRQTGHNLFSLCALTTSTLAFSTQSYDYGVLLCLGCCY